MRAIFSSLPVPMALVFSDGEVVARWIMLPTVGGEKVSKEAKE